jgi:hypothetical protein
MRFWTLASFILLMCWPVLAQPTPDYLKSEDEIHSHDLVLTEVAETLESWLAGRKSQAEFQAFLKSARQRIKSFQRLEKKVAGPVYADEMELLREIQSFAGEKAPDSDGQKSMFLSLSRTTESRTRALMAWRQTQLRRLLAADLTPAQQAYYRWELSWTEVWDREAELTSQLEHAFLDGTGPSPAELLSSFLKLRLQADKIACPESLKALDAKCKERLTLLTRTAEQLLRIRKRRNSGALTRVRRLSRQLSELTQEFQSERLSRLKALQ